MVSAAEMQLILCGGNCQRRGSQRGTARERCCRQRLKASTHPLKTSMMQRESLDNFQGVTFCFGMWLTSANDRMTFEADTVILLISGYIALTRDGNCWSRAKKLGLW